MKEKPILFSTPMVQALLENRKKMTRRTRGLEKVNECPDNWEYQAILVFPIEKNRLEIQFKNITTTNTGTLKVPIKVGDYLWVKETYYAYGYWKKTGELTKTGKVKYKFKDITMDRGHRYLYETGSEKPNKVLNQNAVKDGITGWFKRPSLFMPKVASRIKLEVAGVHCERLQDISESDAIDEGIEKVCDYGETGYKDYTRPDEAFSDIDAKLSFATLWESINGEDSWIESPWVFIYEFKQIEKC